MTDMIPFDFQGANVRVVEYEGEAWFVAKDVALALGYKKPADSVTRHCKNPREAGSVKHGPLAPQTIIIPERDIYRLVMKSKMPAAERFEEWVVGKVLPTIRKTGSYQAPTTPRNSLDVLEGMVQSLRQQEEHMARLEAETSKANQRLDQIETAHDYFTVVGHAKYYGRSVSLNESQAIGRAASALCKSNGVTRGEIKDQRFGIAKTYPKWVLDQVTGDAETP